MCGVGIYLSAVRQRGGRTYNDLISEDPETVSTVRRIAQRKLEEELEYVETDSVYSYRL